MPNFLIIGAAKAGTTSLHHYLSQHPQVFMSPVKEPKFFALEGEAFNYGGPGDNERMQRSSVVQIDAYRHLFSKAGDKQAIGESSTLYLYSPKAAQRIRHYIPSAKLIAILRNPVERAYSHYLYLRRGGVEYIQTFAEALEAEEDRIKHNWMPTWHYKERGFYYVQLRRYFDIFGRDQIQVHLYEDLQADPLKMLQDIFGFLDIDREFSPRTATRHNISGIPKNRSLHNWLSQPHWIKNYFKSMLPAATTRRINILIRNKNLDRPPLSPEIRSQLLESYREDILKLQDLINRDLSAWLSRVHA